MVVAGVDTDQPVDGAALARAGMGFVARYLGRHPSGDLTAAEAADHHANGVGDLLLWEFSTDDLGSGPSAIAAAIQAVKQARQLGVPTDSSVVLVLCEDNVNPNVAAVIRDAAQGGAVLRSNGYLAGIYGRKEICRPLAAAGQVDATFPVMTWGTDEVGDAWNFRQLPNRGQTTIGGVRCDIDDAPRPIGLWLAQPPPVIIPPPVFTPITGDPAVSGFHDVAVQLEPDPKNPGTAWAGYSDLDVDPAKVLAVTVKTWDPANDAGVDYVHFCAAGFVGAGPGGTAPTRIVVTALSAPPGLVGVRVLVAQ